MSSGSVMAMRGLFIFDGSFAEGLPYFSGFFEDITATISRDTFKC